MKRLFCILIFALLLYIPNVSATNVYWDTNIGGNDSLKTYFSSKNFDISHSERIIFNDIDKSNITYDYENTLDISENHDGSVIALYDNEKNYLYIQFRGTLSFNSNSAYLFKDLTVLESINGWKYISTSNVTNMINMFCGCTNLVVLDISSFNTSKVISMYGMFKDCINLENIIFGNLNTSKLTNMAYMFNNCKKLVELDLSGFDTLNVTDLHGVFRDCLSLRILDLSSFDTSKVIDMSYLFYDCKSLISLNLLGWNTSQVTNMMDMFSCCSTLTVLDLSNFNTSQVTNMREMFYDCTNLKELNIESFDTISVVNMRSMFSGCKVLETINVSSFKTNSVTDFSYMFKDCQKLHSLNLSGWNTKNATDMSAMFSGCYNLISLDLSDWDTQNVTEMQAMFKSCRVLLELDLSSFDTSKVWEMSDMFNGCLVLEKIYVSNLWNTSSVNFSAAMFRSCNALKGGLGSFAESVSYARIDTPENPGNFSVKIGITSEVYKEFVHSYILTPTDIFDLDKITISRNVSYIYDENNKILNIYYKGSLVQKYKIHKWYSEKYDVFDNYFYLKVNESFDFSDISTDFTIYEQKPSYIRIQDGDSIVKGIYIIKVNFSNYNNPGVLSNGILTVNRYYDVSRITLYSGYFNSNLVISDVNDNIVTDGVLNSGYTVNVFIDDKLVDKFGINVVIPLQNVKINYVNKDEYMDYTYDNYLVEAVMVPSNTTDDTSLSWSISDESIAEIDQNGYITVKKPGEVTIYATLLNGNTYEYTTRFEKVIDSISCNLENVDLNLHYSTKLNAEISPLDTTLSHEVKWSSDDPRIVTVHNDGTIYALGAGSTHIYATTANNKKCSILINVPYVSANKLSFDPISNKVYNGKQFKPNITIIYYSGNSGVGLIKAKDYDVYYGTNKNPGKAWVKYVFKGDYTGTKIIYFKILPRKTAISKITSGSKYLKVSYKKLAGVSGYQIAYKIKGAKKWSYTSSKTLSKTIKKLKSKKYYRVTVRGYKNVDNKKYYGAWANIKTIKVK